jgi:hypothetical protein
MDRALAFCASLGYKVFSVNRVLRNWDRLARNGNMLKPYLKNSGILLTVIALRIGDRSLSDSESSKSDISSTKRSEFDCNSYIVGIGDGGHALFSS